MKYEDLEALVFEKVEEFQCFGVLVNINNDLSREIRSRISKAEKASFALSKFFKF